MIIKAEEKVKLIRGKKIIERSLIDYQSNKAHYEMRGFKPYTVKMFVPKENVVNLTKKVKKNVKKTKKKN